MKSRHCLWCGKIGDTEAEENPDNNWLRGISTKIPTLRLDSLKDSCLWFMCFATFNLLAIRIWLCQEFYIGTLSVSIAFVAVVVGMGKLVYSRRCEIWPLCEKSGYEDVFKMICSHRCVLIIRRLNWTGEPGMNRTLDPIRCLYFELQAPSVSFKLCY